MAGYIGSKASVVSSGAERKKTFAITTSTTALTGLVYTPTKVHVFHNGVRLVDGTDFTATNSTSITLTVAAESGDQVVVVSYATFQTSDTVSASAGGTFAGNVAFGDNVKATFGASADLQVFHDGSHSYISDQGEGNIYLRSDNGLVVQNAAGTETVAVFAKDDACELFFNNSKKLNTTSTGIDVTGTVTADAYALDSIALPSAGTATIFNRNTDNNLYIQTDSGNTVNVLDGGQNTMYAVSPTSHIFQISNAEKMRIDSSGNLFVNKTASDLFGAVGHRLGGGGSYASHSRANEPALYVNRNSSNGSALTLTRDGATVGSISVTTSSTAYNTSSDYRLKTDAQPMTGASARVQALNPVNFEWIADGTRVDGFLAHEAATVVPESVTGTKDAMMDEEYEVTPAVLDDDGNETTAAVMGTRSVPDYQGIDQSKLVPLLTAALQEALNKIDTMETRLAALEGN